MFRILGVMLLLLTPLLCAPQLTDDPYDLPENIEGGHIPWSDEATTKHLNLEDPASWSASTEVLDENHAWFRRRRSTDGDGVMDMEAAESVVFTPSHLRTRKRIAHEECRTRHREFASWRRQSANLHTPTRDHCNGYCCYPVAITV